MLGIIHSVNIRYVFYLTTNEETFRCLHHLQHGGLVAPPPDSRKLTRCHKGMMPRRSALVAVSMGDRILAQEPDVPRCRLLEGRTGLHDIGTGVREGQLLTESML